MTNPPPDAPDAQDTPLEFYLTADTPCPYLPNLRERRILTFLETPPQTRALPLLLQSGFRRSQNMLYRPHCASCKACKSVRLRLGDFTPDTAERRILRKNKHLTAAHGAALSSPALHDLFSRYQLSRHADGGMAGMTESDLRAMIEEHTGHARLMTAADGTGRIVCAMLYDDIPDGVSAVYSFFDPALSAQSLGTWMIVTLATWAQAQGKDYLYLGYWIAASRKMAYKARFQPLEILLENGWTDFSTASI